MYTKDRDSAGTSNELSKLDRFYCTSVL